MTTIAVAMKLNINNRLVVSIYNNTYNVLIVYGICSVITALLLRRIQGDSTSIIVPFLAFKNPVMEILIFGIPLYTLHT